LPMHNGGNGATAGADTWGIIVLSGYAAFAQFPFPVARHG